MSPLRLASEFQEVFVDQISSPVYELLQRFAQDEAFVAKIVSIFGDRSDPDSLEALRQQWESKDFSDLPNIEFVDLNDLQGAKGAFSDGTRTIYLAQDSMQEGNSHSQTIAVLLEEIGHFVDFKINTADTPGDEGALFSAMLRKQPLSTAQLAQIKAEDDGATLILDGQNIQVEQAVEPLLSEVGEAIAQLVETFTTAKMLITDITSGVTQFLDQFPTTINNQVFRNLPILGDQLLASANQGVAFLKTITAEIESQIGALNQVSDGATSFLNAILEQPLNLVRQGLFDVLQAEGRLPSTIASAADIPKPVLADIFNSFLNASSTDPATLLRQALTTALGADRLGVLSAGETLADDLLEKLLTRLQTDIANPLSSLVEQVGQRPLQVLDRVLDSALGQDVQLVSTGNDVTFSLDFGDRSFSSKDVSFNADVGAAGILSFSAEGTAAASITPKFKLGFAYDRASNQVFIDTAADQLSLGLSASTDFSAEGKLGFLKVTATDNLSDPEINLNVGIDLQGGIGNRLNVKSIPSDAIEFTYDGTAKLDLGIDTGLDLGVDTQLAKIKGLPSIQTNLVASWTINRSTGFTILPSQLALKDVRLDAGKFINQYASPILKTLAEVAEPIKQIGAIVTEPLLPAPLNISLLDVAEQLGFVGDGTADFINQLVGCQVLING